MGKTFRGLTKIGNTSQYGDSGEVIIETENVNVTPTKEEQVINRSEGKYIETVYVDPIPDEYIVPSGTINISKNGSYNVKNYEDAVVDVPSEEVILQDKSVTPTKEVQNVGADQGYTGLRNVEVKAIPEEYIIPSGSLEITENDTYDVTDKASVVVNVPSTGGTNGLQWKCDNIKSLYYEFYQANADISIPLIGLDTSPVENFDYFADSSKGTDSLELDVTNAKTMKYAFRGSSIKSLYLRNMGKNNIVMNYMVQNCTSLETLAGVNLISSSVGSPSLTFGGCKELKNLEVANIRIPFTIGSAGAYGDKLTLESLVNIIKELWDFSSGSTTKKLTMGATNLEKLTNVYVKLVDVTDEMLANDPYINNKKPCVVCESTDEGAMTITEYATSKMWTLA